MADPPHIRRLKGVVQILEAMVRKNSNDANMSRLAFFMSTLTQELADELAELEEIQVRVYMFQIGEVISWIGHGDNTRLPEQVKTFADLIEPENNANPDAGTGPHRQIGAESG